MNKLFLQNDFATKIITIRSPGERLTSSRSQRRQTLFGFRESCLVYLWVPYFAHNQYIFGGGVLLRKFDNMSAELSGILQSSTGKAIKPLLFMYYPAISIYWGLKISQV